MRVRFLALTAVVAFAVAFASAQPPLIQPPLPVPPVRVPDAPPADPSSASRPADKPKADRLPEFEVQMADGSTLMVTVSDSVATVQTKYGTLSVPVKDLLKVELGFRFPDGVEAKVDAAVADLGSPSYPAREAAERALMKHMEFAVPAVRRAMKSSDPEVSRRAESLLGRLTKAVPAERMPTREYDLIETTEYSIKGRLTNATLKARTRYFGETTLQLAEARQLTAVATGGRDFVLKANEFSRQNNGQMNWFDTNVDIAEGRPLEIVCSGQIDLNPQYPGQQVCGPNGLQFEPGQGNRPAPLAVRQPTMIQSYGAVTGRIGSSGRPFFIGTGYKVLNAPAGGRLYLQLQQNPYGQESAGSFKVRVLTGE